MKRLILSLLLISFIHTSYSQTTLAGPFAFGDGSCDLTNWTLSGGDIGCSAAADFRISCTNSATFGESQTATYDGVSTVGQTNISVTWNGELCNSACGAGAFPGIILEYDAGSGFTSTGVTFTDDTDGGGETAITASLPAGAEGAANLQIRFTYTTDAAAGEYYIDDVSILAACSGGEPASSRTINAETSIQSTSMQLNWGSGDGDEVLVIMRQANAVTTDPADGATTITSNAAFTSGTDISGAGGTDGEYAVYQGNGTNVVVTGLTEGVTYHYKVFALNCPSNPDFRTSDEPSASETTCADPTTDPTSTSSTDQTAETLSLTWAGGDGDNYIVVMRQAAAVTSTPADGTVYAASTTFTDGTDVSGAGGTDGEYVVYQGTSTTVTVSSLTPNTNYQWKVYSYNNCSSDPQYKDAGIADDATTSTDKVFYSQAGDLSVLGNWNAARDGSGAAPTDFADNDTEWRIQDATSSLSAGNLDISGATNSFIYIESGQSFADGTGNQIIGTVNIEGTGTLTINHATEPTLGTLASGSTVIFAGDANDVPSTTFHNFQNTTAVTAAGNVTVTNNFDNDADFAMGINTLIVNGDLIGSSTISGSAGCSFVLNGTGNPTSSLQISGSLTNVTINRSSGVVQLGSTLALTGILTLTDGILDLNGNTLNFVGTSTIAGAGTIRTTSTSTINTLTTATNLGTLNIDQTGAIGNRTLGTLNVRRPVTLSGDLVVSTILRVPTADGLLTLSAGNTLFIDGDYVDSNLGTIASTSTSNIQFRNSAALTGALDFETGFQDINNLIVNCSATSVTAGVGSNLTVFGGVSVTTGILDITGTVSESGSPNLTVGTNGTLRISSTAAFPSITTVNLDRTSTVEYAGTNTVANQSYGNLTISGTGTLGSGGATLRGDLNVPSGGSFNMGGFSFTLQSDANGTAAILATNADGGSGGSITNATNVTQQRYTDVAAGTKWRQYACAIAGRTLEDWDDNVATSSDGTWTGTDDDGNTFNSIQFYDEATAAAGTAATDGYVNPTATSDAIPIGVDKSGVWVYTANIDMPATLDATGTFTQGNVSDASLSDGATPDENRSGFHSLGNPYPCPVDLDNVDANAGTSNINSYHRFSESTGTFSTIAAADLDPGEFVLASGEGFFVQVVDNTTGAIAWDEDDKQSSQTTDGYQNRQAPKDFMAIRMALDDGVYIENANVLLHDDASITQSDARMDARKLGNFSGGTHMALMSDWGDQMSYIAMNTEENAEIPIFISQYFKNGNLKNYDLSFTEIEEIIESGICLILENRIDNEFIVLEEGMTYNFSMRDTATVPHLFLHVNSPATVASVCENNMDGSLTANVSGNYNIVWKDYVGNVISNNTTIDNLQAGYYTIEATSTANDECPSISKVVQVNKLTLEETIANSCYENDGTIDLNIVGDGNNFNYSWSNGETTSSISGLAASSYNVTVTDDLGCTKEETYTTELKINDFNLNNEASATCAGMNSGTLSISVTGDGSAFTYNWSNGASTETLTGLSANETVDVTVTDEMGCNTTQSFTIDEKVNTFDVSESINDACFGETNASIITNVTGTGTSFVYNWSNNATTNQVTGLAANTYSLTITDEMGCSHTESFTVTEVNEITADFNTSTDTVNIANGGFIYVNNYSNGANNYSWDFGNGNISDDFAPWNEYTATGVYTIVLTAINGQCTNETSKQVVVINVTGLDELDALNNIHSYKNGNKIVVDYNSQPLDNITINCFNTSGQVVSSQTKTINGNGTIQLEAPKAQGVYLLEITGKDLHHLNKFVVTK